MHALIVVQKMKWLLAALVATGATAVLGDLRPWQASSQSMGLLIIWVLSPMTMGWMFLSRNQFPIARILLLLFVGGLLLVWGMGAVIAIADSSFDGNLGLLFWPALEWIALFGIFAVWVLEGVGRRNKEAQQASAADGDKPSN